MKAVEFKSQLENGKIVVPMESGLAEGQAVRVLVLVEDLAQTKLPVSPGKHCIWDQIEGCWQGDPLVCEDQGDYPVRLELE